MNVVDLDVYRAEREGRELGPARFMTLSEVHADLDLAIDEVLSEPVDVDFDFDEEPVERDTLPPTAPIDGSWKPVAVVRRKWVLA